MRTIGRTVGVLGVDYYGRPNDGGRELGIGDSVE
jgi:hypothetical protein